LALRAAALDAGYATLTATRRQMQQDRQALSKEQQALPTLEADHRQQADALHSAEQRCRAARQALIDANPLLQQVRSIDQRLADQQRTIEAEQLARQQDSQGLERLRAQREAEQRKLEQATQRLGQVQDYLQQHARDEWLVSGLAGVKEQLQG